MVNGRLGVGIKTSRYEGEMRSTIVLLSSDNYFLDKGLKATLLPCHITPEAGAE